MPSKFHCHSFNAVDITKGGGGGGAQCVTPKSKELYSKD